jgi:plasmid stabilization system protein ParE
LIYTAEALRQISDLVEHYERKQHLEAILNLSAALRSAEQRISADPDGGLPAPRPYPGLAAPGRAWVKSGRYWLAYSPTIPPVILGVFYDSANIPDRI